MKRRVVFLVLATGAAVAISFVTARHLRSQEILNRARTPFTMEIHEKSTTLDVNQTLERRSFFARRSDGSTSEGSYTQVANGLSTLTRSVTLVPDRKRVLVHDLTDSVSTQFLPQKAVIAVKAGPADPTCVSHPGELRRVRVLGHGEFLGYQVVKVLLEDPSSGSTEELWEAPVLDCTPLYSKAELKLRADRGRLWAIAEKTAVSIQLGEPRPDLFTIPESFKEVAPSALVEEASRKENVPLCEDTRKPLSRLDQVYKEGWSKRP